MKIILWSALLSALVLTTGPTISASADDATQYVHLPSNLDPEEHTYRLKHGTKVFVNAEYVVMWQVRSNGALQDRTASFRDVVGVARTASATILKFADGSSLRFPARATVIYDPARFRSFRFVGPDEPLPAKLAKRRPDYVVP